MTPETHVTNDSGRRRVTLRRAAALVGSLVVVSSLVALLGAAYLWPLFLFPLLLAAVFFFELGSLAVTVWLGNFFVFYYSFRAPATTDIIRQALLGTVLFFAAGLLLGRVQRRNQAAQRDLATSTLTDRLTGLYNYGTFVDYLRNEITKSDRYGGELSLIMLDLDHFKQFNDRYGHEAGNDLLRGLGTAINSLVREADVAARYGGEEFAVLIRGDESQGYELAERLRRAIEEIPASVHGEQVFTSVSAGVATYPDGARDETELIERADAALYESKRRGRNRVTISAARSDDEPALPASLSA